jgi:hypothetical protein
MVPGAEECSRESAVALAPARALARGTRAGLLLLRVLLDYPPEGARDAAADYLDANATELRSDGLDVETLVTLSAPCCR